MTFRRRPTCHVKLKTRQSSKALRQRPPFIRFTLTGAMPPQTFFLVSLPTSITPSGDKDEALNTLRAAVSSDFGTTYPFAIPSFKVGTLDALVQQADELAKLEQGCKGVVDKIADSLRSLLDGDEDKIQEQKVVNDSTDN